MKNLPNVITCLRCAAALLLLPLFYNFGFSVPFAATYLACGIGDVLDGFLARRLNARTRLGAILDSAADLVLRRCLR